MPKVPVYSDMNRPKKMLRKMVLLVLLGRGGKTCAKRKGSLLTLSPSGLSVIMQSQTLVPTTGEGLALLPWLGA